MTALTTGLDPDDGVDVGDAAARGRAGTEAGAGRIVSISCAIKKEKSSLSCSVAIHKAQRHSGEGSLSERRECEMCSLCAYNSKSQ